MCRKQEGMQMTSDVRKALGEKARIERDKATAKEEAARKALLEVGILLRDYNRNLLAVLLAV